MSEILKYLDNFGVPNSVFPPTAHLTFGPWIYLVPQYRPENILMLGYAGGTAAGLVRLLYGNVPITAVDIKKYDDKFNVEFIQEDARRFVKTCGHFDTVIVDISRDDEKKTCDFVMSEEFAKDVSGKGNYIIVNTIGDTDMTAYGFLELVGVNKPSGCGNKIYYFQTVKIPNLKIFE